MAYKFVIALAFLAVANAGVVVPAAPVLAKTVELEEYDPHPQYRYGYDVQDSLSGDSKGHVEERDGDVVRGEYSLIDADGFKRTVSYVADPVNGFNAVVRRDPLVVAAPVVKAAPVVAAAPAPVVAAAPAPLVRAAPVVAPAPLVRAAPVVAPAPLVRAAPVVAPAPIVRAAPLVAPAPVVRAAPVVAPAPVVRAAPLVAPAPIVRAVAPLAAPFSYAAPAPIVKAAPFVAAPAYAALNYAPAPYAVRNL